MAERASSAKKKTRNRLERKGDKLTKTMIFMVSISSRCASSSVSRRPPGTSTPACHPVTMAPHNTCRAPVNTRLAATHNGPSLLCAIAPDRRRSATFDGPAEEFSDHKPGALFPSRGNRGQANRLNSFGDLAITRSCPVTCDFFLERGGEGGVIL